MDPVTREPSGARPSRPFATRVTANRRLSANAFELMLAKPAGFAFSAGQRLQLEIADVRRDYSIASAPSEKDIRLCIRQVARGRLSAHLAHAGAGARVTFTGPHGYFTFKPSPRPAVFVATGTGIAPFRAMAGAGVRGFTLLHGVKSSEQLYYREFFQARAAVYVACLTAGRTTGPAEFSGRVGDYLRSRLAPGTYDFYLCGRQDMIRDVTLLIDEAFDGSLVYSEIFY